MLFPAEERRAGWINVGDLASAVHFKIVKYERIKFLVIALRYLHILDSTQKGSVEDPDLAF